MKIGTKKYYAGVLDIPTRRRKPAGTTLSSGNLRTAIFGQTSENLVFDEPTVWHELSEKGRGVWMTDYPIEQRQSDEMVQRAKGRVLVGGLGLGYAVVALVARPKVKEIVVVECNPAIIKLVWEATVARCRTLFPKHKVKLSVVHAGLFEYLKDRQAAKGAKPEYNWGLFDIWQGDGEGVFHETVVPLRALAHGVVSSLVCWNEDVMRGQLLQGLETRLYMLRRPVQDKVGLLTLDKLTEDSGSVYTQWAVPFWRWFKDHQKADAELVRLVMKVYVHNYGRPEATNGLPAMRRYRSEVLTETAAQEADWAAV